MRLQFAGAICHVTFRGIERRPVFKDDRDRVRLLETLEELADRHRVHVYPAAADGVRHRPVPTCLMRMRRGQARLLRRQGIGALHMRDCIDPPRLDVRGTNG